MNGISLLVVALAAVGIEVGWEAASDSQLRYTIRFEKAYLDPLREGQAIVSPVEQKDSGLVNFQIAMESGINERQPPAQETMVEYGWRPSENGGIDYLVQISPERLETLSNGVPIWAQVSSEVTDIRRFYIFAGVGKLPREKPVQAQTAPEPPQFLRDDGSATPASGERNQSSLTSAQGSSRYGNPPYLSQDGRNVPSSNGNTERPRGNYAPREQGDADWQNKGDPNRQDPPSGRSQYDPRESSNGSRFGNVNTYPSASVRDSATGGRYDGRYALAPPQRESTTPVYRQNTPIATAQTQQMGGYPTLPAQAPAVQHATAVQQALAAPAVATTSVVAQAAPIAPLVQTAMPSRAQDEVRPWTPLILTTLALFASLGANAYLGWLAWSFFWRYRDAASDIVRARQTSHRQAA
jgi:hypothetical protein